LIPVADTVDGDGSPAFELYQREAEASVSQLFGLMVLGVVDEQIANWVTFLELPGLSSFAHPPTLPYVLLEG
jgi:RNA polymerase sigma-70 factor, ECF subfamily